MYSAVRDLSAFTGIAFLGLGGIHPDRDYEHEIPELRLRLRSEREVLRHSSLPRWKPFASSGVEAMKFRAKDFEL